MPEQTSPRKQRTGRSPGYPSIDLQSALEKAERLHKAEGKHPAHFSTVMHHWGYSAKSGSGRLAFAALKKFGLIEVTGQGAGRSARVSDTALRIIIDERPDSAERRQLLQAAALRPKIHRELWATYRGALPSDTELLFRLKSDRGFTQAGAADFLAQLRKTLAYAKVDASTRMEAAAPDEDDDEIGNGDEDSAEERGNVNSTDRPRTHGLHGGSGGGQPPLIHPPTSGPHVRFTLAGDNILEVSLRSRVSKSEFAKIKAIIDLAEGSFVDPEAGP